MSDNHAKSILLVLAHNNFRDEEYIQVRRSLENAGATVTTTSTVTHNAIGSQGLTLNPDLLIDDVNPADYDAVVFIGGTGASQYWHDVKAHEIASSLDSTGKVVAAISHAPIILAVAGLLADRRVTSHIAVYEKLQICGATFTGKKLEIDDNIITASGVNAVKEFSDALTKAII
jgi:protease I